MKVLALLLCLLYFSAAGVNAQSVWQSNLDGRVQFYQTTDFGIVLAGTERSLYAFDGQSGQTLWRKKKTRRLDETSITPIPGTDLILISTDEGDKSRVEAVDLLSGGTLWRSDKVKGDVMQLAVEPASDLLAVVLVKKPFGKAGDEFKRKPVVHVFNLSNGNELWKKSLDSDIEMMPSRFDSDDKIAFTLDNYRPPLILDDRLFLFYEGATSYDARTGSEKEREKFKINESGLALTEADPVFNGTFLFTSGRGKIRAVNRRSGKIEWEAKDLGVTPEMAVVGDILYVRTGGQFTRIKDGETQEKGSFGVSAIDARNGKTLWRYKGADKGLTNFVFSDANTILIADRDDLTILDAKKGKRLERIKHDVEKAAFVLVNERGDAVVGGRDEIAAFKVQSSKFKVQSSKFEVRSAFVEIQNPKSKIQNRALWRVKHKAPGRGVFRTIAGIAARAAALYFRYGGLATSALSVARTGLSAAQAVNSFRWSGLKTRFSSVNLSTLASDAARGYVSRQISVYGVAAQNANLLNRINNLQIPTSTNVRGRVLRSVTPTRADVQESLLDRLDPATQLEKLSSYFLRRQRLAALRDNFMYFYTDLPKPFDKKGLVGVNVQNGRDQRFILINEPDPRFITDETVNLLYTADGNKLQAFEILNR